MQPGKTLLILGSIFMVLGALFLWAPWALTWFGRLPGDIRIEREGFRFYMPITSMLLASVALSLVMRLIARS